MKSKSFESSDNEPAAKYPRHRFSKKQAFCLAAGLEQQALRHATRRDAKVREGLEALKRWEEKR